MTCHYAQQLENHVGRVFFPQAVEGEWIAAHDSSRNICVLSLSMLVGMVQKSNLR
jgi:hypothetical protein